MRGKRARAIRRALLAQHPDEGVSVREYRAAKRAWKRRGRRAVR